MRDLPRIPIRRERQLEAIDDDECVAGYRAGLRGAPEPGPEASFSYWHGWRNGMGDSHRRPPDVASRELARDCVRNGMWEKLFGFPAKEEAPDEPPR